MAIRMFLSIVLLAACAGLASGTLFSQIPAEAWPPKKPLIPDNIKVTKDVRYGPYSDNLLDILEPKERARKRPGVLLIHGGGWIGGSRDWVAEHVCLRYVERGFVCANVEYRVAKVATAPAAVQDVLLAAQWFEKNARKYGVDRRRIVVTGDSAGGHLALMVGMTPKSARLGPRPRVRAVVNFFGITDLGDQLHGPNRRDYTVRWVPEKESRADLARLVSPLAYIRSDLPPILTIHGTADPSVPYEHGERLTRQLNEAGARAVLVTVRDGLHGFPKAQTDEIYDRFVWPFLASVGVIRSSALPSPAWREADHRLVCSPEERCAFSR
jgi:acetyl esterase/lipase